MALRTKSSVNMDLHFYGEPWSFEDLEHIPHLHSLVEAGRKAIIASKTLKDTNIDNKEFYANLIALCNRDFLSYLKITNQYYLLSTIFKEYSEPKAKGRWLKILEEWRRHGKNVVQLYYSLILKNNSRVASYQLSPPLFSWTHPATSLPLVEQLAHYEREKQRITVAYHVARSDVYIRTIHHNLNEINKAIEFMENDPDANHEDLVHAKEMRDQLTARYDHLKTIAEALRNGGDAALAPQDVMDARAEALASNQILKSVLNQSSYNAEQIEQIVKESDERANNDEIQINALSLAHAQEMRNITIEENKMLDVAKQKISGVVDSVINKLKAIDVEKEGVPKNFVIDSINKLEQIKGAIPNIQELSNLRDLFTQCNEIINTTSKITDANLTEEMELLNQVDSSGAKGHQSQHRPTSAGAQGDISNMFPDNMPKPSAPPFNGGARNDAYQSQTQVNLLNGVIDIPQRRMEKPSAPPFNGDARNDAYQSQIQENLLNGAIDIPQRSMEKPNAPPLDNERDNLQRPIDKENSPNITTEHLDKPEPSNTMQHMKSALLHLKDTSKETVAQREKGEVVREVHMPLPSAPLDAGGSINSNNQALSELQSAIASLGEAIPSVKNHKLALQSMKANGGDLDDIRKALQPLKNGVDTLSEEDLSSASERELKKISVRINKITKLLNKEEILEQIKELAEIIQKIPPNSELSPLKGKTEPIEHMLNTFNENQSSFKNGF